MSKFIDLSGLKEFLRKCNERYATWKATDALSGRLDTLDTIVSETKADKDTTAVAGNLAKFDNSGNPIDAGVKSSDFVKVGSFMLADGLIDTRSAGTAQEFVHRASGGDGYAYMKKLKGKSVVWNQLVNLSDVSTTSSDVSIVISNSKITASGTVSSETALFYFLPVATIKYKANHSYLLINPKQSEAGFYIQWEGLGTHAYQGNTIVSASSDSQGRAIMRGNKNAVVNFSGYIMCIDLTLLFSSGNEPSTVAEFEALYPELYHAACAGKLVNNDAVSIKTIGADNAWENTLPLNLTSLTSDGEPVFPEGMKSAPAVQDELVPDATDGIARTAIQKVGTRAYQSGDESDATLLTDGTNTNYPLAEPIVHTLDTPVKCYYPVDEDGTEQAIFPVHADGTPSAPFCADTNYSISIAKLVSRLNNG